MTSPNESCEYPEIIRPIAKRDYRMYVRKYICQNDGTEMNYKEYYDLYAKDDGMIQLPLSYEGHENYNSIEHKYMQCVANGIVSAYDIIHNVFRMIASYFI